MLTSIEGVYENGVVRLLEPLPGVAWARVVITVLPETLTPLPVQEMPSVWHSSEGVATGSEPLTGDAVVDSYQPRTELGRKLIERRRAYVKAGGKLLSWEEIDAEVRERRGGLADD